MLGYVLEEGRKLGAEAFTLEVRTGNQPAIRLYEKFGFIGEGVRKGFYKAALGRNGDDREDALIMWKGRKGMEELPLFLLPKLMYNNRYSDGL